MLLLKLKLFIAPLFKAAIWVSISFLIAVYFAVADKFFVGVWAIILDINVDVLRTIFNTGIPIALTLGAVLDAFLIVGKLENIPSVSVKTMAILLLLLCAILFFLAELLSLKNSQYDDYIFALFYTLSIILIYFKWISFYSKEPIIKTI